MLYGESKSAGSCGHFKFHTNRDTTASTERLEKRRLLLYAGVDQPLRRL